MIKLVKKMTNLKITKNCIHLPNRESMNEDEHCKEILEALPIVQLLYEIVYQYI